MSLDLAGPLQRAPGAGCTCGCLTRARRYPSDTTDAEWRVLAGLLPIRLALTKLGGRPEKHARRAIVDAIFYLVDNGIKWRALPADFPPWQTVYALMRRWSDDGATVTWSTCCAAISAPHWAATLLRARGASTHSRCTSPPKASSAATPADSTTTRRSTAANATSSPTPSPLLVSVLVTPACMQDRDAAWKPLYWAARRGIRHIFADHGYEGPLTDRCEDLLGVAVEIVHRPRAKPEGFQVLPRRWGRRAVFRLDQPAPTLRSRLRTPTPPAHLDGPMGRHPADDPTPGPHNTNPSNASSPLLPDRTDILTEDVAVLATNCCAHSWRVTTHGGESGRGD